jgi:hypothetical protein
MLQATRRFGALALLAVGAVHLQQYLGAEYRSVPTIGPLFLLNAIGSFIAGILLLAPIERVIGGRLGDLSVGLLATVGVAIAVGSLVAVLIAENGTIFGFAEDGYSTPIVVAIVAEAITTVLLAPVAALALSRRMPFAGGSRLRASERRSPALSSR